MPSNRRGEIYASAGPPPCSSVCLTVCPLVVISVTAGPSTRSSRQEVTRVPETKRQRLNQSNVNWKSVVLNLVCFTCCCVSQCDTFFVSLPLRCYPLICFAVVPNGPAEPDAEPANQMSWKEGRQLLRK